MKKRYILFLIGGLLLAVTFGAGYLVAYEKFAPSKERGETTVSPVVTSVPRGSSVPTVEKIGMSVSPTPTTKPTATATSTEVVLTPVVTPKDEYNFDYVDFIITEEHQPDWESFWSTLREDVMKTALAIPDVKTVINDMDPLVIRAYEEDEKGSLFPSNNGFINDKPGLDLPWGYYPPVSGENGLDHMHLGLSYYWVQKDEHQREYFQSRSLPYVKVLDEVIKGLKREGVPEERLEEYLPEIAAATWRVWSDSAINAFGAPGEPGTWEAAHLELLKETVPKIIDTHTYIMAKSLTEGETHQSLQSFPFTTRVELLSPAYLSFLIHPPVSNITSQTTLHDPNLFRYVGYGTVQLMPINAWFMKIPGVAYAGVCNTNLDTDWPKVFQAIDNAENESTLGFPTIKDYENLPEVKAEGGIKRNYINMFRPSFLQPIDFTSVPVAGYSVKLTDKYLGHQTDSYTNSEVIRKGSSEWAGLSRFLTAFQEGKTKEEKELLLERARVAHKISALQPDNSARVVNAAIVATYFESKYHIPIILVGYPLPKGTDARGKYEWGWGAGDWDDTGSADEPPLEAVTDLAFCMGGNCSKPLTAIDFGKKLYFIPYSDPIGVGFKISDTPHLP